MTTREEWRKEMLEYIARGGFQCWDRCDRCGLYFKELYHIEELHLAICEKCVLVILGSILRAVVGHE